MEERKPRTPQSQQAPGAYDYEPNNPTEVPGQLHTAPGKPLAYHMGDHRRWRHEGRRERNILRKQQQPHVKGPPSAQKEVGSPVLTCLAVKQPVSEDPECLAYHSSFHLPRPSGHGVHPCSQHRLPTESPSQPGAAASVPCHRSLEQSSIGGGGGEGSFHPLHPFGGS